MSVLVDWESGDDFHEAPTLREMSDWERREEAQASGDEPCRECRGRGYDRRNPDEPCPRCDGECVEPSW